MKTIERNPGDRIGRLTLIEEVQRDPSSPIKYHVRQRRFRFRCDCGNEVVSNWKPHSCGCLQREIAAETGRKRRLPAGMTALRNNYVKLVNNATLRGIECRVAQSLFEKLVRQRCHYCGITPDERTPFNGLDRVDSSGHYTDDNVVSCCKTCNFAKNTLPQGAFYAWVSRAHAFLTKEGRL